ncbi:DUF5908 family protein [Reichenbachiella sp.]|uniref:DUF5908 family protein n=1 Tax=Reichenbachiella sp. TaxID=2184521 RepID=UPI003BB1B985
MPVEIREIIIKTDISSNSHNKLTEDSADWQEFRNQLLADCKKMINKKTREKKPKR